MKKTNYVSRKLRSIKRLDSQAIDNLYRQENVGGNKFEKKLKALEKELKDVTRELKDFDAKNYISRFFSAEDNYIYEEKRRKLSFRKSDIEGKIEKLKEHIEEEKIDSYVKGGYNERIIPSKELQNMIVEGNLYLCEVYANKYKNVFNVEYDDIYQTAVIGLMSAARYYVPSKIAKFSTYASKCIENRILREYKTKKKSTVNYGDLLLELDILLDILHLIEDEKYWQATQYIRTHNKKMYLMGIPKYSIEKKNITKAESKKIVWNYFTKLYNKLSRSMGLSLSITNEERDFISLELSYKRKYKIYNETRYIDRPKKQESAITLERYIFLYMKKLCNAILYNEVIEDLIKRDIPVTDEEIIKEANKRIKSYRKTFKDVKNRLEDYDGIVLSNDERIYKEYLNIYYRLYGIDKIWYDRNCSPCVREYHGGYLETTPKPYEEELESIFSASDYNNERKWLTRYIEKIQDYLEDINLNKIVFNNADKETISYIRDTICEIEDYADILSLVDPSLTKEYLESFREIKKDKDYLLKVKNELLPKIKNVVDSFNKEKTKETFISAFNKYMTEVKEEVKKLDEELDKMNNANNTIINAIIAIATTIKSKRIYELLDRYVGGKTANLYKLSSSELRDMFKYMDAHLNMTIFELNGIVYKGNCALRDCPYGDIFGRDSLSIAIRRIIETLNDDEYPDFKKELEKKYGEAFSLIKQVQEQDIDKYEFVKRFSEGPFKEMVKDKDNALYKRELDKFQGIEIPDVEYDNYFFKNVSRIEGYISDATKTIDKSNECHRIVENTIMRLLTTVKSKKINQIVKKEFPYVNMSATSFEYTHINGVMNFYDKIRKPAQEAIENINEQIKAAKEALELEEKLFSERGKTRVDEIIDKLTWEFRYSDKAEALEYMKNEYKEFFELIDSLKYRKISKKDFYTTFRESIYQKLVDDNEIYQAKEDTFRTRYADKVIKERKKHVKELTKEITEGIFEQNREYFDCSIYEKLGIKKWDQPTLDMIKVFYETQVIVDTDFLESTISRKERTVKQTPEDEIITTLFMDDYSRALSELDEVERNVLTLYFDSDGIKSYTPKEIANELGITTKEVTSIKTKALKKIRNNPIMKKYENNYIE